MVDIFNRRDTGKCPYWPKCRPEYECLYECCAGIISVTWNDRNCPYACCDGYSETYTIAIKRKNYDNLEDDDDLEDDDLEDYLLHLEDYNIGADNLKADDLKVCYIVSIFCGEKNETSKYENSWPILSLTKELVNNQICFYTGLDRIGTAEKMKKILTELVNLLSEDPELPLEKMFGLFHKLYLRPSKDLLNI